MSKQSRKARNRSARAARERRRRLFWIGGVVTVAVVALALVALTRASDDAAPGVSMPIQGQQHIQPGEAHPPYNSDPPTSGWHYEAPLPTGFYEEPAPDEQLVHNLEHGHVVISYDCDRLDDCEAVKGQLRGIFDRYDGWKVTAVPRTNADAAIALTAWGRIDKLESYDEGRITAFIDAWRDRGPEQTME
ncbi:MAG: DUF3105 domain-containing protein [Anaerolineae bacterium]|nr:DUF3105 domain-containing protein [Anaerolineae bacterium]